MCIPDGNFINETVRLDDEHMDNIQNLLPGLPDEFAEDLLNSVCNGEALRDFTA
jgi:hypothetical protein